MKIKEVLTLTTILTLTPISAYSTTPTFTGDDAAGSLAADSSGVTVTTPPFGDWTGSGTIFSRLYVCDSQKQEISTLESDDSQMPSTNPGCLKVSEATAMHATVSSGVISFSNLFAYFGSAWEPFDVSAHGQNLVLENMFTDISGNRYTRSDSVTVTPLSVSEPTHDGNHSLSINGDSIVADPGVWTPAASGNAPRYLIWACDSEHPARDTPISYQNFPLDTCGILRGDSSVAPSTLSSALYQGLGNPERVPFDPSVHGNHVFLISIYNDAANNVDREVRTASIFVEGSSPSDEDATADTNRFSAPAPFPGPVITSPSIPANNAPGAQVTIPGSNLETVSEVTIGDSEAESTITGGNLLVTIPETLEPGTYDLVVSSSTGNVTISDAITVSGTAVNATEAPRGSTIRIDDEVKVRVFNPAGAGKVQIFVNGEEIAWVRTEDPNDPKLTNGYLVRTVELAPGKNVIEIFVEGERIRRNAYGL